MGIDLQTAEKAFEHLEDRICLPIERNEFNDKISQAWEENTDFKRIGGYGYGSWVDEALGESNISLVEGDGQHDNTIQMARTLMPTKDKKFRRPASDLFEKTFTGDKTSILDQGNLTVYLLTQAKKVVFNNDKEAVGVELISPSGNFTSYVKRGGKIYLSAGVYETPKILMVSRNTVLL